MMLHSFLISALNQLHTLAAQLVPKEPVLSIWYEAGWVPELLRILVSVSVDVDMQRDNHINISKSLKGLVL